MRQMDTTWIYIHPEDIQCNGNVSMEAVDREARRAGIAKEYLSQKLISELHHLAETISTEELTLKTENHNVFRVVFTKK